MGMFQKACCPSCGMYIVIFIFITSRATDPRMLVYSALISKETIV